MQLQHVSHLFSSVCQSAIKMRAELIDPVFGVGVALLC